MEGSAWWDVYNEEYIIHTAQSLCFSEIHTPKVGTVKDSAICFLLEPNYSVKWEKSLLWVMQKHGIQLQQHLNSEVRVQPQRSL